MNVCCPGVFHGRCFLLSCMFMCLIARGRRSPGDFPDIMTEALNAKYICAGSPTLNRSMLPTMGGFLAYFKGLAPRNRIGLAFGSYGWSGQSVSHIEDVLKSCGFRMMTSIKQQYVPDDGTLQSITEQVKREISWQHWKVRKQQKIWWTPVFLLLKCRHYFLREFFLLGFI